MLGRQKASLGPPGDPVKGSCQGLGVINYGSAGSAARHRQGWGETSRVVLLIGGHRGSGSRLASPGHRDRDTGVAQGARGPDRATGLGQRGRERGWRASSVRPGRVPLSISVSSCPHAASCWWLVSIGGVTAGLCRGRRCPQLVPCPQLLPVTRARPRSSAACWETAPTARVKSPSNGSVARLKSHP